MYVTFRAEKTYKKKFSKALYAPGSKGRQNAICKIWGDGGDYGAILGCVKRTVSKMIALPWSRAKTSAD